MLLSLFALSILFIPFTLIEAPAGGRLFWTHPRNMDTHAQYGLNLTFAGWLKSGTVRYIQAAFGSPEQVASTAHTRQIWPKEARFCVAAYCVYGALKRYENAHQQFQRSHCHKAYKY